MQLPFGLSQKRSPTEPELESPTATIDRDEAAVPSLDGAGQAALRRRKPFLRQNFVLGALLVAITLAVYGQTCRFDFIVLDDPSYVKWNRYVLDGLKPTSLQWAFCQFNDSNWIPLTWVSLMADAMAYHNWPDGYHITNVLLHVTNVLLVFVIFSQMTGCAARSAFAAALFAVHPLHVESVAWITERKDVLCTLFGLLSLWAYVSYARSHRRSLYVAAFGCLVLSLMAKQTFVTLPCVFLLLDYWPLKRIGLSFNAATGVGDLDAPDARATFRELVKEKIPFFALVAAFSAIAVWAQSVGGIRSLEQFPFRARVLNAISAYGWYAWKALVPTGLAVFYPHPIERLQPVDVIVPAVFLVAVTAFALFNFRRRPYLIVGWLWYLGTLFPLIGLIQIGKQRVADRYAYLPLLGLYLAVALLVPSLVPNVKLRRWLLPTAAAVVIAIYGYLGFKQVRLWNDDVKLFQHALAVTENNAMSRCSLGCALLGQGDVKGAIANIEESLRLDPDDALAHEDLGSAYQKEKRLKDAEREYRKSIELNLDSASPHEGLGTILCEWHRYEEARQEFKRALEIEPRAAMTYYNLARLCEDTREYDQALAYAKRGLELDPKHIECQREIAHVLAQQGRLDEALAAFEKVAVMAPADMESRLKIQQLAQKKLREQTANN